MEKFTKFQSIYKEIADDNINWEEIPENLREVFLNSSQLNAQEVAKLPFNIRVAYLIANKPPDNVILEKTLHFRYSVCYNIFIFTPKVSN